MSLVAQYPEGLPDIEKIIPSKRCPYCNRACGSDRSYIAHKAACPKRNEENVPGILPERSAVRREMERYGFLHKANLPDHLWVQKLASEWRLMRKAIDYHIKLCNKLTSPK